MHHRELQRAIGPGNALVELNGDGSTLSANLDAVACRNIALLEKHVLARKACAFAVWLPVGEAEAIDHGR